MVGVCAYCFKFVFSARMELTCFIGLLTISTNHDLKHSLYAFFSPPILQGTFDKNNKIQLFYTVGLSWLLLLFLLLLLLLPLLLSCVLCQIRKAFHQSLICFRA
jgi:hypothetical protein